MAKIFTKILLLLFVISISNISLSAQNKAVQGGISYYVIPELDNPGNPKNIHMDGDADGGTGWTTRVPAGSGPIFSPKIKMPFNFTLGDSTFTTADSFKIASAGYITFDKDTVIVVDYDNEALPSNKLPNYSVTMWGLTVAGASDLIRTKVVGTSPNRQLWIQFFSVSTPGASLNNFSYYSLVLEETSNNVYFVDMWGGNNFEGYVSPTLTYGIQINDSTAFQVAGSPNLVNSNVSNANSDNDYYIMLPGVQPAFNLDLKKHGLSDLYVVGTEITLPVTIKNYGSQLVDSFSFSYQLNGGIVVTSKIKSNPLTSGEQGQFDHPTTFTASTPGSFTDIKMWIHNLNDGELDENPLNDTLSFSIFVNNGITGDKKVLFEEFSTAPCQFCPDGAVHIENLKNQSNKVIVAQIHAGFGTDLMTIGAHNSFASMFANGAPTAMTDRVLYSDETRVGYSRASNTSSALWIDRTLARLSDITPANVSVNVSYDKNIRKITGDVQVHILDHPYPGDIRLTVYATESTVVGFGNGYDQVNAYNGNFGHPYYGAGNPIVGYEHKDVLRVMMSPTWGTNSPFGGSVVKDSTYTIPISFTLPSTYNGSSIDDDQISVVALVHYYHPSDASKNSVINVDAARILYGVGVEELSLDNKIKLYPNPVLDQVNIEIELETASSVTLELFNVLGSSYGVQDLGTLTKGFSLVPVSLNLESGMYYMQLTIDGQKVVKKINVQ